MITEKKVEALRKFYRQQQFSRMHRLLLSELELFNRIVYITVDTKTERDIVNFLDLFFDFLLRPDFRIGAYVKYYFSHITLLENLTRLCRHGTTQKIFDGLKLADGCEPAKLFLVMNLRTELDLDLVDSLFETDPVLGSCWIYSVYHRHSFCDDRVFANVRSLQRRVLNYELYPCENMAALYFNATYVDPDNHLAVRKKVNHAIVKHMQLPAIENNCAGNAVPEVALLSKNWQREKAVQKCIGAFIQGLKGKVNLSLINFGNRRTPDTGKLFKKIFTLKNKNGFPDYGPIVKNNFDLVIFTDVGLNTESLILSNLKIAPVQIAMYGHPVSTAADTMDYFVVGALSETAEIDLHYTERTLLIQGTGMNSVKPKMKRPTFVEKRGGLAQERVNIYLTATLAKINPVIRRCWKEIQGMARGKAVFHLLPGTAAMQEVSVVQQDLQEMMGEENIVIYRNLEFANYMNVVQRCDFGLGSFHYGDYNRIVEALWVGTPIISVRGKCGYQNTGVAALTALGFPELIAENLSAYVDKALGLINSRRTRTRLQRKVLETDLTGCLINNRSAIDDFSTIIKNLIHNSKLRRAG